MKRTCLPGIRVSAEALSLSAAVMGNRWHLMMMLMYLREMAHTHYGGLVNTQAVTETCSKAFLNKKKEKKADQQIKIMNTCVPKRGD